MGLWLVIALARLVVVGIVAAIGVYLSASLFQALTPRVDVWDEIARGNAAVGAVLAGVIFGVALVIYPVVSVPLEGLDLGPGEAAVVLLIEGLRLLFGVGVGALAVILSAGLYNLMTGPIDEKLELQRGNVAVGLVEAGMVVGTALLLSAPAASLVRSVLQALVG
ncbi:MAG: DUF350 domain-containing protein [Anaerolineae bacterium]|nr:DUF350 domain-containing protein [Anaerolineae bacterium]